MFDLDVLIDYVVRNWEYIQIGFVIFAILSFISFPIIFLKIQNKQDDENRKKDETNEAKPN